MRFYLLILDDEPMVCNSLRRILEEEDREIFTATNLTKAREILQSQPVDLLLLDFKLDAADGITFLKEVREDFPEILIIMITAYGNIDIAVEAMRNGAYDFIQKKEEPDFIRYTVSRALENLRLKKEVEELRHSFQLESPLPAIVAFSPGMKRTLYLAEQFAQTDSTVLITGETGTGKNLIAHYVHLNSHRFNRPFISINCAAIPHELLESELFGYEKGAFTGAHQKGKKGLIEQANGGTLFLDEIGELSLDLQSKLLHVLERNEIYRLGAETPTTIDVRFIAATNSDLQELVDQKRFRLDLFYRLNVANIEVPPLRERQEDILPIAKQFVEIFNKKFNKKVHRITVEAESFLRSYYWPGNVRELRNMIERAMLLNRSGILKMEDLSLNPIDLRCPEPPEDHAQFKVLLNPAQGENLLQQAQRQLIEQALEMTGNNRSRAARLLGIPRTSLNFYIQKYGLKT